MTHSDFVWWLHGWSEINGGAAPNAQQWQIINDHLDLVFNKVTPNRQQFCMPSTYVARPENMMVSGCGIVPISGGTQFSLATQVNYTGGGRLSGDFKSLFGPDRGNQEKVFITVSRVPIYDPSAHYSFYQFAGTGNSSTRALLDDHGVGFVGDKVYLVVDNKLGPTKATYADNMHGTSDHLTMVSKTGPGIINVGVGQIHIC